MCFKSANWITHFYFSELKDNYTTAEFKAEKLEGMPELLKAMIGADPNIFGGESGKRS